MFYLVSQLLGMAKIHHLSITHFRGIKRFEQTFSSDFVCLIGRGDSGKSTILDAIASVLSSTWNIPFYDNDFHECDLEKPIVIEATLRDLPPELIAEEKYGGYLRTLNLSMNTVSDDVDGGDEAVLTIRLEVRRDLEPIWTVFTNREIGSKPIGAGDRAKLNAFLVSDYVDRHFSWNKGSPLYSLYMQHAKPDEDDTAMIDALREAKKKIDDTPFARFNEVVNKVTANAATYGVTISKTGNTIDFKELVIKDGKLSMHDQDIPFRLKGKGSRRLISMAIQTAIADAGGIILIDEVEQGLEPDRVQNLVNRLKGEHKGQVFITTHSRDVLVELSHENLFLIRKDQAHLTVFDKTMRGVLRANPEAFFARKVLVVEGQTEEGICRALNHYRQSNGDERAALLGVKLAIGRGDTCFEYAARFAKAGFPTALLCDSDEKPKEKKAEKKAALRAADILVVDWEKGDSVELAIAKHLPFDGIAQLIKLATDIKVEENDSLTPDEAKNRIWEAVGAKYGKACPPFENIKDNKAIREAIGNAAKTGGWFKSISWGLRLGGLIFSHLDSMAKDNILRKQFLALSTWIDK